MKHHFVAIVGVALLAAAPAFAETLELPGLSAPATVNTDSLGVPHIVAETLEDAVCAQGWVHARDRFFQMDLGRRRARGRAAELTGDFLDLGSDFFLRPLDLESAAQRSVELHTDEERRLVQHYADGVNAWLASHPLPDEYGELEITRTAAWTVVDSVLVGKLFSVPYNLLSHEDAGYTAYLDQYLEAGANASPPFDGMVLLDEDVGRWAPLDPAATVPDAGGTLPIVPPPAPLMSRSAPAARAAPSAAAGRLARRYVDRGADLPWAAEMSRGLGIGSNAWGVAASETESGAPLVANDGHLDLTLPAVFYENHLVVTGDPNGPNLSGLSFPGTALILVGQSEHLAWGSTSAFFDGVDVFEDRLVRGDPACPARLCIESESAMHPVEERMEAFLRNDPSDGLPDSLQHFSDQQVLSVPFRGFGLILEVDDGSVTDPAGSGPAETTVLTQQWTGLYGTRETGGPLRWARATDVFEFRDGVKLLTAQAQSWVVADSAGNLAFFTSSELPLRADLEAGAVFGPPPYAVRDGSGPANWIADPARSQGQTLPYAVLPFDEMPQVVNPPNGFVVSANGDPLGVQLDNDPLSSFRAAKPGSFYYLGEFFTKGNRPGRITQLLRDATDAVDPVTLDDMVTFQGNTQVLHAEKILPFLLTAWQNAQLPGAPAELAGFTGDADVALAMNRLSTWDLSFPTGIPGGYDAAEEGGVLEPVVSSEEAAASVAATLYHVWGLRLIANTLERALAAIDPGLPVFRELTRLVAIYHHLSQVPFTGVGASGVDFFPEPASLAAEERRDVVLLQSLRDALDALASNAYADAFGGSTDQDDYRWGLLHRVVLQHPLGGDRDVPPGGGYSDLGPQLPGIPRDGAPDAVNTSVTFGSTSGDQGLVISVGSGYRFVASPGDPDAAPDAVRGLSNLAGGASGDSTDPTYTSQLPDWLTVDHHDVLVNEADVMTAAVSTEDAIAAEVSKGQRSCIQETNKRGAAAGKVQGKEVASCVKQAAKGKESDPQTCLTADAKGKLAKANEKALKGEAKKCGERPLFAYAGAPTAAGAGVDAALGITEDVLGTDANGAVLTKVADKSGAACQAELLKRAQKALETVWKEAGKAKKNALAGKQGAEPAESGSEVQDALASAFAPSAKVQKALDKLESGAAKKCAGGVDLVAAAPGRCADADLADVTDCLQARALCRGCRSLNAMDAMALPCDTLDDGDVNDSC